MIIKNFELRKKITENSKYFLLYGNNRGFIEETLNKVIKPAKQGNTFNYEENDILKNLDSFEEKIFSKSFFDNQKIIIIKRASDKILKTFEKIINENLEDVVIILISDILEKKSKLRTFSEKNKYVITVPFYEDNQQSLSNLANNFLKEKKISLSQENINLIVNRCRGDRINLFNELDKIENLALTKKKISINEILRLTNLSENFDASELVDSTLAKQQKKTLNILNENNFASEDVIMILRIFLYKLKRLLKIQDKMKIEKNLEKIILNYRPPIFWKEKDLIKEQIKFLSQQKIHELIIKTNEVELLAKKNPTSSINILTNFILEEATATNN